LHPPHGRSALLKYLDKLPREETNLPVTIGEHPENGGSWVWRSAGQIRPAERKMGYREMTMS